MAYGPCRSGAMAGFARVAATKSYWRGAGDPRQAHNRARMAGPLELDLSLVRATTGHR